ncbi:MAG: 5'/3'-nucleotidase SurE [Magnetococcales bacterium]|nr:5'/3'-nucleotidase SurE [Magnetococcales bacterium]
MQILITNDDGVQSPGLKALADAVGRLGEVTVVAPDRNRSGASHAITVEQSLKATDYGQRWYSLDGTPADCIQVAIRQILTSTPDLVVTGINTGPNLAEDVYYSGTVGAAREAVLMGIPALAVSLAGEPPWHFETAARFAAVLAGQWRTRLLPRSTFLNINVPNGPIFAIKNPIVTRPGRRQRPSRTLGGPVTDALYWRPHPGASDKRYMEDFQAVAAGHVSVTPLHIDAFLDDAMEELAKWPTFL